MKSLSPYQMPNSWGLAALISLTIHTLLFWAILLLPPVQAPKKKVVQVEAITLAAITPKPEGGGGGQAGPPPPSQELPKPPPPKPPPPKPVVKPKPKPVVKPQPEPEPIPERLALPRPAPVVSPAPSRPSSSPTAGSAATYGRGSGSGSGTGTGRGYGSGSGTGSGSGSGTGSGAGAGTALQGYLAKVRSLLERNKIYPSQARSRNEQGTVVVRFTISADGRIAGISLSRSSGSSILDQAAQETVNKVGRFPPIPAEVQKNSLTVQVPLAYRLQGG
mgnify:FL=1